MEFNKHNPHVPLALRLWSRVQKTESCWLWTGHTTRDGYGMIGDKGKGRPVHRVAYETLVGSIPDGLQLDHLCRTRNCVNPDHLEPVTNEENQRRSWVAQPVRPSQYRDKTHCPQGHEYTPENTMTRKGRKPGLLRRDCKTCHREREERKRRAAGVPKRGVT